MQDWVSGEKEKRGGGKATHVFKNFGSIRNGQTNIFLNGDVIWENPSHVAQNNFAEINKITLKSLCFSLFSMNFNNT